MSIEVRLLTTLTIIFTLLTLISSVALFIDDTNMAAAFITSFLLTITIMCSVAATLLHAKDKQCND